MKLFDWYRTISAAGEMTHLQDMERRLRRRGLTRSADAVKAAYDTVEDEAAHRVAFGWDRRSYGRRGRDGGAS